MGVDFSSLVLAPAMQVFGRDITVDPVASRPGVAPYAARGVFSSKPVDVQLQDGSIMSDQQTTVGIRNAEFVVVPGQGDRITIAGTVYFVDDVDDDGQGGSMIALRKVVPVP